MKINSTVAPLDFGVKLWDVLTLYNRGKDRTVVVLEITISVDRNTVTTINVSNNKYIRAVQIKFLKVKKYLYEKYISGKK